MKTKVKIQNPLMAGITFAFAIYSCTMCLMHHFNYKTENFRVRGNEEVSTKM